MQWVIVTVRGKDESRSRDLVLPADPESARLAELVAQALRWDNDQADQPV